MRLPKARVRIKAGIRKINESDSKMAIITLARNTIEIATHFSGAKTISLMLILLFTIREYVLTAKCAKVMAKSGFSAMGIRIALMIIMFRT